MQGSISLSWGKYGGFYFHSGYTIRLCLGWIAFTYLPIEIDLLCENFGDIHKEKIKEDEKFNK